MEAGADDLILKPVQPADLERKLIAAQRVTACTAGCTATRARTR